MANISLSWPDL